MKRKKYILLIFTVIVVSSLFYFGSMLQNSSSNELSIEKIEFDEVLKKISNGESFYLYIEFKEDPERKNFKATILSIAKEKEIKLYQTDSYIFDEVEGVTGAKIVKKSTLQFYNKEGKENAIESGHPFEEYQSFFNNPSGSLDKIETVEFNIDESIEDLYTGLYPIRENGKYGYINDQGKVIILPQFEYAGLFYEGLAEVKIGSKYGYINDEGKIVIPTQFDSAGRFSEGLATIGKNMGDRYKFGFIDKKGNIIIDLRYDTTESFSDGLALVKLEGKYGYIDKNGINIVPLQYDEALSFFEGRAAIKTKDKWGFIDNKGNIVVSPIFTYLNLETGFSEGLASVGDWGNMGYINTDGEYIIDKKFDDADHFSNGLAPVSQNGKFGFIDKTGKFVISPKFEFADEFSKIGLAAVKYSRRYGYINKKGEFVIAPQFDRVEEFIGKLAKVYIEDETSYVDKFGYINVKGKFVWRPTN